MQSVHRSVSAMEEMQHFPPRPKFIPDRPALSRSSTRSTTPTTKQQTLKKVRFESKTEDISVSSSAQLRRRTDQKAPPHLKTTPTRSAHYLHSHVNEGKVPPPCPEVPFTRGLQKPRTRRSKVNPNIEQAEELSKDAASQHHPQPRYYRDRDARETDETTTLHRADHQIKAYYGDQS